VKTSLGDDALLLDNFQSYERVSTPFRYILKLLSTDAAVDMKTLLSKPVVLSIVAQGEAVVCIVREQGRYAEDGRGYDMHAVQEFVFREGKLARILEICARS